MYRVIYLSAAADFVDETELNSLLTKSRAYNNSNEITGILLHIDGDFIQVLEGNENAVSELFDKIKNDHRHKGVITVIQGNVEKRQFSDWSMGYKATNYQEISKIDGLAEFNRVALFNSDEKIALTFLSVFLKSHRANVNIS